MPNQTVDIGKQQRHFGRFQLRTRSNPKKTIELHMNAIIAITDNNNNDKPYPAVGDGRVGTPFGASFLDDPVIGAYFVDLAEVGIRIASMASSPFSYDTVKSGQFTDPTDIGETWAAVLWDMRNGLAGVGGLIP